MSNRIPYIPKQTIDFKPRHYIYCETDTAAKFITRTNDAYLKRL